jgi:hypothetical protein
MYYNVQAEDVLCIMTFSVVNFVEERGGFARDNYQHHHNIFND